MNISLEIIPDHLKKRLYDRVLDFIVDSARKFNQDGLADKFRSLKTDGALIDQFNKGIVKGIDRFIKEYELIDEDLVHDIIEKKTEFLTSSLKEALFTVVQNPDRFSWEERNEIIDSFEQILPNRKNRERVERAVIYWLDCIAKEVWHLPEFQPFYAIYFQRISAETAQKQLAVQLAQLDETKSLNHSFKNAILQLSSVIAANKNLSAPNGEVQQKPEKIKHNLPQPDYGNFIGRIKEIDQIKNVLKPYPQSRYHLLTIDGIGGVGKSSLALEIGIDFLHNQLNLKEEERFSAIIWITAKSIFLNAQGIRKGKDQNSTLEDIISTILDVIDNQEVKQTGAEEQLKLCNRLLVTTRSLIIIDNFETIDDEGVMQFLMEIPIPSKVLITTRHKIDTAYPLRLLGMDIEDATNLIRKECNAKNVELTRTQQLELLRVVGGIPLAIIWSISQLSLGYSYPVLLKKLSAGNSDVSKYCFSMIVEELDKKHCLALRILCVIAMFAQNCHRDAISKILDITDEERDDNLVYLEHLSLINKISDRFSMLILTQTYIRTLKREILEDAELITRWLSYFTENERSNSDGYWQWSDYSWLLQEGENILGVVNWAESSGRADKALSVIKSVMRYLDIKGKWQEAKEVGARLYASAQNVNDLDSIAWMGIHGIGWLYVDLLMLDEAEIIAKRSLLIYKEKNDHIGECFALKHLGRIYRRSLEFEKSQQAYQTGINIARNFNLDDASLSLLLELAKLERDLKNWKASYDHFQAVIDYFSSGDQKKVDVTYLMEALGGAGWSAFHLGDVEKGKELLGDSLKYEKILDVKGYLVVVKFRLGLVEYELGNTQSAEALLEESLTWATQLGIKREQELIPNILKNWKK
ncbi:NB-ARC domain-containing protein [Pedobacter sp. MC2016-05]|uniref:tetratricopeptide repeat protein n=1 Tax=Pedobacter sp. MC2016-05 TaxID=2994474 RepID=UPI0022477974|nr:tetratricopeptide repeat protein [Pedobacter sp. MC2016-05]MCX2476074.1 NB-ARC domain-containing protein [Pedobacter sp. MC2016-05]